MTTKEHLEVVWLARPLLWNLEAEGEGQEAASRTILNPQLHLLIEKGALGDGLQVASLILLSIAYCTDV